MTSQRAHPSHPRRQDQVLLQLQSLPDLLHVHHETELRSCLALRHQVSVTTMLTGTASSACTLRKPLILHKASLEHLGPLEMPMARPLTRWRPLQRCVGRGMFLSCPLQLVCDATLVQLLSFCFHVRDRTFAMTSMEAILAPAKVAAPVTPTLTRVYDSIVSTFEHRHLFSSFSLHTARPEVIRCLRHPLPCSFPASALVRCARGMTIDLICPRLSIFI